MLTKVIFNYFPAGKFNVSNFNRWFKLCIHPLSVCLCVCTCARTHTHNSSDDAEWECRSTVLGTKNYHCSFPPILCGRMNSEHSLKVSTFVVSALCSLFDINKKNFLLALVQRGIPYFHIWTSPSSQLQPTTHHSVLPFMSAKEEGFNTRS